MQSKEPSLKLTEITINVQPRVRTIQPYTIAITIKKKAVAKPLVTVTATVTVRSANFRSASIS